MARKGQFKKGGGRVGAVVRRRRSGGALTRTRTRTVVRYKTRRVGAVVHRRRRGRARGGSGGVTAGKLAIAGIGLGVLMSQNMGPATVRAFAEKIPGSKTFGSVAIVGLGLGAIERFTGIGGRYRSWLRAAGAVGLVAAAIKVGTDNTGFKFVGDEYYDPDQIMDVVTD